MNTIENKTPIKSHGWLWKIPLGIVVLLLECLAVTILTINSIALGQINRALKTNFTEGGSLEAIDIGLMAGRVELNGFTVNPPNGHGTDPLLSLDNLVLDVVPTSLLSDVIVVEKVALKGMSFNLVRDKKGRLGLAELVSAGNSGSEKRAPDKRSETKEQELPVVYVNKIQIEDGSLNVRDYALTGKPMVFPLKDIRLLVDQLRLFDDNKGADPAAVSFFQLKQPGKLPSAYFGTVARVGSVARGIPPINAQIRLIGLKLDTSGSLIPPATRTALGGDAPKPQNPFLSLLNY